MHSELIENTECRITALAVKNSATNIIPKGNVVIATRVGLGKVCLLQEDTAINQDLRAIIPRNSEKLFVPFLFWWLKSIAHLIVAEGTGATVQGVKLPFIKSLQIPLPQYSEQRRIVAILDKVFAGLATATANAEKNLKNVRELSATTFTFIFNGNAAKWLSTTIGDQLTLQRGFDITKKQQNSGSVPVVSSGGIKSFHDVAMAQAPGVVLGRKGSLGTVFLLEQDYWPHDTTLWVKDFKGNDPQFVYYFFKSLKLAKLDTGAANPALNRNVVHPIGVN